MSDLLGCIYVVVFFPAFLLKGILDGDIGKRKPASEPAPVPHLPSHPGDYEAYLEQDAALQALYDADEAIDREAWTLGPTGWMIRLTRSNQTGNAIRTPYGMTPWRYSESQRADAQVHAGAPPCSLSENAPTRLLWLRYARRDSF